ncbi:MAG: DUF374 domain-containing protein, partial [Armatimonadota bacterium]|nr:DUF374 domain-containing protein [Armatimonadota bacterium]
MVDSSWPELPATQTTQRTSAEARTPVPPSKWTLARNRALGRFIALIARAVGSTLRLTVRGNEHLRRAEERGRAGSGGALFAVWHGHMIVPAVAMRDRGYVVLISRSADGEVAAATLGGLGWRVLRGSRFWGQVAAARAVVKALRKGHIVAITPDGPRGPARVAAQGTAMLAMYTDCDLHPVGIAAPGWRLSTWDSLLIPFPFARGIIVIGAALPAIPLLAKEGLGEVATGQTDSDSIGARELEAALKHCEEEAQTALAQQSKQARNQRYFYLFNTLLLPLFPLLGLYTLWRRYVQGRSAAS